MCADQTQNQKTPKNICGWIHCKTDNTNKKHVHYKKCAACECIRYCSRDCQKLDWSKHQLICKSLKLQNNNTQELSNNSSISIISPSNTTNTTNNNNNITTTNTTNNSSLSNPQQQTITRTKKNRRRRRRRKKPQ